MEEFQPGKWLTLEQQVLELKTDGKTIMDLTAYHGIALWWFIRFRFFNRARTTSLIRSLTRNKLIFSLADFVYDLTTAITCRLVSGLVGGKATAGGKTVLVTVHDRDWKSMSFPGGNQFKVDTFFYPVIQLLQRKGFRIVTVTPLKADLVSGLKTMIGRMEYRREALVHREFNSYWSMKIWDMENEARKSFGEAWRQASKNKKLMLTLKRADLEDDLPYYFDNIFGYVAKCLEMAGKLVEEERPDFILVSSEHGIIQKSVMVAGKLRNIPTMALQHGTIGQVHRGYLSWKGSISESGDIGSPFCPVPDKTAVFGPYYFNLLTEASAYPANMVAVTGQPRYDALATASRIYDRGKFCQKWGLDRGKKIVLIATENLPIPDGKALLRSALRALRGFPEVQIVIKPHPAEEGEWYKQAVEEEGAKTRILPRNADTYEALYACDLFMADFSTVILEGIILGKPGVTVHLGGRADPTPYFRGVTLRVYREEELVPAIRKAIYDASTMKLLQKAREEFVSQHVYKLDGKATERVVDIIEEMVKERT